MLTLYNYFRSSPSYRVRIALNLKGLSYTAIPVNLLEGVQAGPDNRARNPQGLVPTLEVEEGVFLTQSPAILEWLEETYPNPPLLPREALARARVRAMAAVIGCDIHPLNNLRVMAYLRENFAQDQAARDAWAQTWIAAGFAALERLVEESPAQGAFCYGDAPSLPDLYLIPQIYSAQRFKVDIDAYPRLAAINARALALPAFADAHPDAPPSAPPT